MISRRSSRPCQWLGLRVENPEDSLPSPSRSILFRQKATITQTDRRLLSSQTRTGRDSTDTIGPERQVAHWLGCTTRQIHVFWAHSGPSASKACFFRRDRKYSYSGSEPQRA